MSVLLTTCLVNVYRVPGKKKTIWKKRMSRGIGPANVNCAYRRADENYQLNVAMMKRIDEALSMR